MNSQLSSFGGFLPSRKGCRYAKIPLTTKIRLFKGVTEEGIPIKRVSSKLQKISEKLNIKYSTAKTLVRQFRDQQIKIDLSVLENETNAIPSKKSNRLRAGYREVCPMGAQNLAKDDDASEMNLTAIISHKETAECHAGLPSKSPVRVELVSKTISRY